MRDCALYSHSICPHLLLSEYEVFYLNPKAHTQNENTHSANSQGRLCRIYYLASQRTNKDKLITANIKKLFIHINKNTLLKLQE